ncbi:MULTISPECIES: NUDIX hydrolase [unclassified Microbacterium]|uniref:NUDIX hydrolase n=1 Tax=unclassified Microbacterium TaxID=2609290 RepID=UPI00097F67B5|nr:NUDIX domain-containing protein [Microbacterium sp. JB110]RCS61979.1 NUDIX domain-containing protein [Microbacterium sp. JB110]SJM66991.1 Nudix hydrolase family protein PA3470 [Frigoribacterium sp. JB110]
MIDHENRIIHVSAVVLRHPETGAVLSVRKRGTRMFMQPGGKPEPGESAVDAAVREIREELSVELDRDCMSLLGTFEAPAANEGGYRVRGTVFTHPPVEVVSPAAEIEELRWVDADGPLGDEFAPLMIDHILPALRARAL